MVDVLEMAYIGEPDGWVHIHRMANWSGNGHDLPPETVEYFVNLSKALLDERERLKSANRSTRDSQILEVAINRLNIYKPSIGRPSLDDQSNAEFFQSVSWKHASAVLEKLENDPLLMETEAFEQIAEKAGTTSEGKPVHANTVRRAWRYAQNHPSSGLYFNLFPLFRKEAQKQYLAETIANYSHSRARFRTLKLKTKIPQVVRKFTSIKNADEVIEITTMTPACELKESEHFIDEDGIQDSHAYFSEVLAQCVLIDGERYTAEVWSGVVTTFTIFIGEKIIAKLEHREPRKHWP